MLPWIAAALLTTAAQAADEIKPHEYRLSIQCADTRCTDGLAAVKSSLESLAKKVEWEVKNKSCRRDAYFVVELSAEGVTYARVRDRLDGGEESTYDDGPEACTGAPEHRAISVEVRSDEEIKADDAWEGLALAGQERQVQWAMGGEKAKEHAEYVAIWEKDSKKVDGRAKKGDVAEALDRKTRFVVAGNHGVWQLPRSLAEVELKGKPKKTRVNVLFEQTLVGGEVVGTQVLFRWKVPDGEEAKPQIEGFAKDLASSLAEAGVLAGAPEAVAPKAFAPCEHPER